MCIKHLPTLVKLAPVLNNNWDVSHLLIQLAPVSNTNWNILGHICTYYSPGALVQCPLGTLLVHVMCITILPTLVLIITVYDTHWNILGHISTYCNLCALVQCPPDT
jgi:hypothetical protein